MGNCPLDPLTIVEAATYREFLKLAFQQLKAHAPSFSYQVFANKSGLRAKSFASDVISGRKRLTQGSIHKFIKGMNLTGDLKELFAILVCLEEPEIHYKNYQRSNLPHLLDSCRKRILGRASSVESPKTEIFANFDCPKVYAALGSIETGSTKDEIKSRIEISNPRLSKALRLLIEANLARFDSKNNSYYPETLNIVLSNKEQDDFFRGHFIHSLKALTKITASDFRDPSHLFLQSIISVKQEHLTQIRNELRALILRYIESVEVSDGDTVVTLTLGFKK